MKGFTLVETLVALAALAMLATGAMAVSSASTASQDAIRAHQEATHTLMRLRATMKADLSQAAARRARDVNGAKAQAALAGGALGDGVFLSLVRRGWDNPLEQERSSLQYVEYRLSGARLERRWRRHVDGSPLQQPQVLAEGVQSLRLEFLERRTGLSRAPYAFLWTWPMAGPCRRFFSCLRRRSDEVGTGQITARCGRSATDSADRGGRAFGDCSLGAG
jgi:general secretion pathway protein J